MVHMLNSPHSKISIHALLAESDIVMVGLLMFNLYFYPRSPCGERQDTLSTLNRPKEFLSTLSLRRATHPQTSGHPHNTDFYPRSPCGERLISPHSAPDNGRFLSTLSLRRATASNQPEQQEQHISIHALLAESDIRLPTALRTPHQRFLSTLSLRRATQSGFRLLCWYSKFLSTLSLRRATAVNMKS